MQKLHIYKMHKFWLQTVLLQNWSTSAVPSLLFIFSDERENSMVNKINVRMHEHDVSKF